MAKTGWQICRCITKVASSDNSKLLDRDGLECNLTNPSGIPISASGKKQAAKVWSKINPSTELVPGTSFTYSTYYDIVSTYSVTTTGVSTSTLIYQDGVIVGRYRGGIGETCEISNVVVFETSPLSAELEGKANSSSSIQFAITSNINGTSVNWSITSSPSWLTVQKDNNLVKLTSYQRNLDTSDREDEVYSTPSREEEILLTQNTSGETISIPVSQAGLDIVRLKVIDIAEELNYTKVYCQGRTDYLGQLIDTPWRVVAILASGMNIVTDLQILQIVDAQQDSYVKVNAKLYTLYGGGIRGIAFSKIY